MLRPVASLTAHTPSWPFSGMVAKLHSSSPLAASSANARSPSAAYCPLATGPTGSSSNVTSCGAVASAAAVVVHRNAVNAALCLLVSLVGLAGLFIQLDAGLLAFVLLLVYAGAVVALFLFIVMLLDTKGHTHSFRPLSVVAAALAGLGKRYALTLAA